MFRLIVSFFPDEPVGFIKVCCALTDASPEFNGQCRKFLFMNRRNIPAVDFSFCSLLINIIRHKWTLSGYQL